MIVSRSQIDGGELTAIEMLRVFPDEMIEREFAPLRLKQHAVLDGSSLRNGAIDRRDDTLRIVVDWSDSVSQFAREEVDERRVLVAAGPLGFIEIHAVVLDPCFD